MPKEKLTKRAVEAALPAADRYTVYDTLIPGFGLRVYPSGQKSYVFEYRPGEGGRRAPAKRVTIGLAASADGIRDPDYTADGARRKAEQLRALVLTGGDPQGEKATQRVAPTVKEVAEAFIAEHVAVNLKASTKEYYEDLLTRLVLPTLGTMKAKDVKDEDISRLHRAVRKPLAIDPDKKPRPFIANRVLAVIGAMYAWAEGPSGKRVPKGTNPTVGVAKFIEPSRDSKMLTADQLDRLGATLREAETNGLPWELNPDGKHKHLPKEGRVTVVSPSAVAAIRLLIFTGARLREILHVRWDQVDLERGILLLPIHKTNRKTGMKTIVLNAPAMAILSELDRIGVYVIAGESAGQKDEKPRSDLKRPWALVTKHAGLEGLRIHDLRHNFASVGVSGGMGLPIVGKLLGHTQMATTQRYSHLDNDPLHKASNAIGAELAARLSGDKGADILPMRQKGTA